MRILVQVCSGETCRGSQSLDKIPLSFAFKQFSKGEGDPGLSLPLFLEVLRMTLCPKNTNLKPPDNQS